MPHMAKERCASDWGCGFDLWVGVVPPLPPTRTHASRGEGAVRGARTKRATSEHVADKTMKEGEVR